MPALDSLARFRFFCENGKNSAIDPRKEEVADAVVDAIMSYLLKTAAPATKTKVEVLSTSTPDTNDSNPPISSVIFEKEIQVQGELSDFPFTPLGFSASINVSTTIIGQKPERPRDDRFWRPWNIIVHLLSTFNGDKVFFPKLPKDDNYSVTVDLGLVKLLDLPDVSFDPTDFNAGLVQVKNKVTEHFDQLLTDDKSWSFLRCLIKSEEFPYNMKALEGSEKGLLRLLDRALVAVLPAEAWISLADKKLPREVEEEIQKLSREQISKYMRPAEELISSPLVRFHLNDPSREDIAL